MHIIRLLLFIVLLLNATISRAENNIMFDKANQLYHNKLYDSAALLYQQMLNDGYCSADLFYNSGNAYYRINKIGMAVWCYEKALQLKEDKNYIENLHLTQKRIKEPIERVKDIFFIRWWESFYNLFSSNTWAIYALLCFLISIALLFLRRMKFNISFSGNITGALFTLAAFCLFMSLVNGYQQTYHYEGIVITPKTLLTFQGKKEPVFLSEGIKVRVIDEKVSRNASTYIKVKLPDGRIGSMDKAAIKKL